MAIIADYIDPVVGCRVRIHDDDVEADESKVRRRVELICLAIDARLYREAVARLELAEKDAP